MIVPVLLILCIDYSNNYNGVYCQHHFAQHNVQIRKSALCKFASGLDPTELARHALKTHQALKAQ